MSRTGRMFCGIAVVAAALFAVLIVISLGWLSPEGLSNFDARLLGYDVDAAQAYLAALPDSGRALYLGVFRWLDTVFPVLAAFTIGGATWMIMAEHHLVRRIAASGMAAAYLVMDLAENAYVAQMLRSEGSVAQALVDRSSDMTQLKWLFLGLSLILLLALWRRNKGGAA